MHAHAYAYAYTCIDKDSKEITSFPSWLLSDVLLYVL